ncbi:DUF418 domain-containing protein [Spiractinospora alimapuensis]|nr:DUF418 domain-containing protein [Spiractinospora alimapuensis]
MLLLIVLSNTVFYLYAADHGPSGWHPVDGSVLDSVVQFAMVVGLDLRTFPMFAFLFGYGMMRLYQRQTEAGTAPKAAVALLRRRSLWLFVFGAAHAALLMAGDILGVYALISVVLGWLVLRRTPRTMLVVAGVLYFLLVALTALTYLEFVGGGDASADVPSAVAYAAHETNYFASVGTRLETWLLGSTLLGSLFSFSFHAAMVLGFWAARRRVLEEPRRNLRLLTTTAILGVSVGWLGGLPIALDHVGLLSIPAAAHGPNGPVFMWQVMTGLPGGLGYAALFGLLAMWLSERARRGVVVNAVAALGKRSLSGYLAHSVVFSPVLAAWGLGLGAHLGSASVAAFAVLTWLVTVAGAYALELSDRRGPAEALLRRLMYRDAASR